ncbi:MAG: PDZ domain-containing protein [Mariprofundus sp.]|nr:PDZ domain-containing protein [Mariprofundus sp.]
MKGSEEFELFDDAHKKSKLKPWYFTKEVGMVAGAVFVVVSLIVMGFVSGDPVPVAVSGQGLAEAVPAQWQRVAAATGVAENATNADQGAITGRFAALNLPTSMEPVPFNENLNLELAGNIPNYIPTKLELFEAHWQGMDTTLLDAELRMKMRYPKGLEGVMIEEVTLNAADSGFLAGDVIVRVGTGRVRNLQDFQNETRKLADQLSVNVGVLRKDGMGSNKLYRMNAMSLMMKDSLPLGFAQVEAAPMILPGDFRPHPYRGACTKCHTFGTGFEISPPPDMVTLPPAPITAEQAHILDQPHRDRGACVACHVIQ